ncbi:bifunctional (p)ppGpp synthetase/guanosine-3',5'-bis(diphosphate) 3'-pyrophosphohydrolase [bacterium]|nr:bifunctional (p)ppGpp synthetase/guanosine-3',5'-bis(diphosphate) 3'-pyrophosphohydrolase [bacterium]
MRLEHSVEELMDLVSRYMPDESVQLVQRAYEFARDAHAPQQRKSGDPYIIHPVEVAYILADLQQDPATVAAGLLHDTVEDTGATRDQITQFFGEDIYLLVEGVTKLGKIYFESKEDEQAENFRKMFLAMAQDIRVVIIKLADRLHNMRTLKHLSKEKQILISRETSEIFSPLAHRLGMWSLKWELEDYSFYYLQHEEFQRIKKLVALKRDEREAVVQTVIDDLAPLINRAGITAKIYGRPKHFFSIYKKLVSQNLSYDELFDTLGVRIIVESLQDCYAVLGVVHSMYKPLAGRFKDYIAMPKSNLYQSLHTTVIGKLGRPVEIQIRTKEMHQIAEYGIAAHWRYKEGDTRGHFDGDFAWLRQILETEKEGGAPKEFLQNLKLDLFIDEVFIFTPKGDVQVLPKGATPLDFAYKIHSEIGHSYVGAKINGQIVNTNYRLRSGDRIEILTSKTPSPKLDWLNVVQTRQAKSKIKQWFKRQNQSEIIERGREKLERLLVFLGFVPKDVLTREFTDQLVRQLDYSRPDDVYLALAEGDLSTRDIERVLERLLKIDISSTSAPFAPPSAKQSRRTGIESIKVMGETNVLVTLPRCCSPVPGDPIVGYVTTGRGVAVHRPDCANILSVPDDDRARLVAVEWVLSSRDKTFRASLQIEAFDRIGILEDIIHRITNTKTNIQEIRTKTARTGGRMKATVTVDIRDVQHINVIRQALAQIADVYSIQRLAK